MMNFFRDNSDFMSSRELQRLSRLLSYGKKADICFFDMIKSYLNFKQRLIITRAVRSISNDKNY